MKLSVNILFSALKEAFPQAVLCKKGRQDNALSLQCPHFHSGPVALRSGQIFIVSDDQLPAEAVADGPCLVILSGPYNTARAYKNVSVITVEGVENVALFNQVLTIFNRYSEWDETLQELVFHNAPLDEYLKCSHAFLGNTLSVHNNNFTYLARFPMRPSESAGSDSHKRDFFDPDFLLRVDAQSTQSVFYSKDVIYFQDEITRLEYYFLNLFNGNTAAGRLVVVSSDRPFVPQDHVLVRHLGKYLEAALSYAAFSGSGKNLRRDSLLEYLSGKEHSDDKIMHLQTVSPFSKLKEDQRLYCLAGVCQDSEVTEQYIAYQLERALPDSVCVLYNSMIVFLCANQPKQNTNDLFREITRLLKQYSITAGCSNPFTDFFDLRYCYQEAVFSLQLGMNGKPENHPLHHFKNHTLEHFLRYGCSILPTRLLCADCITKLAEHDKTSSVSYCDSLRVYLDSGMNSAETARQLNVTRNTFLARLERILRYVDLDLADRDNRLYLQLSLRLLQNQLLSGAKFQ